MAREIVRDSEGYRERIGKRLVRGSLRIVRGFSSDGMKKREIGRKVEREGGKYYLLIKGYGRVYIYEKV